MNTTTDTRTAPTAQDAAPIAPVDTPATAPALPAPSAAPSLGLRCEGDDSAPVWEGDTTAPDYLLWYDRRAPDYVLDEPPPPQPAEPTFTASEVAQAVAAAFAIGSAARQAAPPAMVEPMPAPRARPNGCAILLGVVLVFLVSAAVLAAQGNPGGALVAILCALLSVALTPREG